jgi:hypothetical protein
METDKPNQPNDENPKPVAKTRQIHRVVIEGKGSATVVEFQCDGESYWLLIEMNGKSASARWLEPDEVKGLKRDESGEGGIQVPPTEDRL